MQGTLSLGLSSCQHEPPHHMCPFQSCKRLLAALLFTEDWRQGWAKSFNLGLFKVMDYSGLVKYSRGISWQIQSVPLSTLIYWLRPSGTEGSSLCSLLVPALPKARRGEESQTSAETVSPEATFELSIILTLISSTQHVFPGPFPHSSSGPTCEWEVGTWRSISGGRVNFCWLELIRKDCSSSSHHSQSNSLTMPPGFPLFHSMLMCSPRANSIDAFSLPWRQTAMCSDFYFCHFLAVKLSASYSTFLSLFIVRNEPKVVTSEGCCKD